MHSFHKATSKFELFEVDFTRAADGDVRFSETNPQKCAVCHGETARPLWENWTSWAGVYGGDALMMFGQESKKFSTFAAIRDQHPRYKSLLPQSLAGFDFPFGSFNLPFQWHVNNALNLSDGLFNANIGRAAASRLGEQAAKLGKYKYAALAALSCNEPIEGLLPPGHAVPAGWTYAAVEADTFDRGHRQSEASYAFVASTLSGGHVAWENMNTREDPRWLKGHAGKNDDAYRMAAVRFIVEGVLGDGAIKEWSPFYQPTNKDAPPAATYSVGSLGWVEAYAWRGLLSVTADKPLFDAYTNEAKRLRPGGFVMNWIYRGTQLDQLLESPSAQAAQSAICPLLKTASLAALQTSP